MNISNGFIGTVTEVKPETGEARVKNEAEDYVSYWLPFVKVFNGFSCNLEVNDQVLVMMDEYREEGVIIGFVTSEDTPPAFTEQDIVGIKFPNVTITFNKKSGAVNVKSDNVTVEGANLNIKSKAVVFDGDVTIKGKTDAQDITSKTVSSSGLIKSATDVQGAAIKLSTHTHNVTGLGAPTGPSLPT